jgi:hypothetical protein
MQNHTTTARLVKLLPAFAIPPLLAIVLIIGIAAGYRQPTPVQESALLNAQTAQIIVTPDANTTYIATADQPGAAPTAATWQCKKILVSGTVTTITWADGNNAFDNIPGAAGAGLSALSYE